MPASTIESPNAINAGMVSFGGSCMTALEWQKRTEKITRENNKIAAAEEEEDDDDDILTNRKCWSAAGFFTCSLDFIRCQINGRNDINWMEMLSVNIKYNYII